VGWYGTDSSVILRYEAFCKALVGGGAGAFICYFSLKMGVWQCGCHPQCSVNIVIV
jgi:hypothetical protein